MKKIFLALIFMGARLAHGMPVPSVDYKEILSRSDVICVGKVLGVQKDGVAVYEIGGKKITLDQEIASVRCERAYKGDIVVGTNIQVKYPDIQPYQKLRVDSFTMVFVVKSDGSSFRPADPFRWVQPAVQGNIQIADNASTTQKVEVELLHSVYDGDSGTVESALSRLYELKSSSLVSQTNEIMRVVKPSLSEAVEATSIAVRIAQGDLSVLGRIKALKSFQHDRNSYASWEANLLNAIGQINDPKAESQLDDLLLNENRSIRIQAARALRNTANKSSIPYLLKCLSDHNQDVAAECDVILSRISQRPPANYHEFLNNRQKHIRDWNKWWEQNKGK